MAKKEHYHPSKEDIENISRDIVNLNAVIGQYGEKISELYTKFSELTTTLDGRLNFIEGKNLENEVEPETIPIHIVDSSPSAYLKKDSWKISARLKDYLNSLSREAKITAASLAIAGLLGYVGYYNLKSEPETIKIKKNISLTTKCPDMILVYTNKETEDKLLKSVSAYAATNNIKEEFICEIFPTKSYMIFKSSLVCKDGTWDPDSYRVSQEYASLAITDVLNKFKSVAKEQKEIRDSIKTLKSPKSAAKQTKKQPKKKEFNPFD